MKHSPQTLLNGKPIEQRSKVFPRPSRGQLTLEIVKGFRLGSTMIIRNQIGQEVWRQEIVEQMTSIDLSNKPKGLYWLELFNPQVNYTTVEKVILID